jgi:hypothetical protein
MGSQEKALPRQIFIGAAGEMVATMANVHILA